MTEEVEEEEEEGNESVLNVLSEKGRGGILVAETEKGNPGRGEGGLAGKAL